MPWWSVFEEVVSKLERWGAQFVLLLPNLGVAMVVLIVAWIASVVAGKLVARFIGRVSESRALNELIRKLVRFAVVAAGFIVALSVLQLDEAASTFLAGAGIVGLALGFAFQDLSANFIAGVAMAMRRPVEIDDLLESNDVTGLVKRIELRSTWLETLDGKIVMIPNRKIFENVLINHSRLGRRRVELEVGVSYAEDLEEVQRVASAALATVTPRLDRPTEIFFQSFGDSSITFIGRFWIEYHTQADYLAARSAAIVAIRRAFAESGITIPFPIQTLDFGIAGGVALREELDQARASQNGSKQS
ncbi:MAG TPA: mechanosensitive ion channel family protein [Kofleriaceae bacterium]|nr:mechanosensitive ion channel family protein [Kofleriaceae bacterium]